jgi:hypothetical protein
MIVIILVLLLLFLFFLEFGPGQLTSLHFILSYKAGFYKPTTLKVHPPICRITAHATVPGYFSTILASMILLQINGA